MICEDHIALSSTSSVLASCKRVRCGEDVPAPNNVPVQAEAGRRHPGRKTRLAKSKSSLQFCRCPGRLRASTRLQDIPAVPHKLHVHVIMVTMAHKNRSEST